ncbi:MAG: hypothetical protein EOM17_14320 [Synergistales bacterium]|nr:hypothetical protein [Synergistales bacterium]
MEREGKIAEKLAAALNEQGSAPLEWFRPKVVLIVREGYIHSAPRLSPENLTSCEHVRCMSRQREARHPSPPVVAHFGDHRGYRLELGELGRIFNAALQINGIESTALFVQEWGPFEDGKPVFNEHDLFRFTKSNPYTGEESEEQCFPMEFFSVAEMCAIALHLRTTMYLWEQMENGRFPVGYNHEGKVFIKKADIGDISISDSLQNEIAYSLQQAEIKGSASSEVAPFVLAALLRDGMKTARFGTEVVVRGGCLIPYQVPKNLLSLLWKIAQDTISYSLSGSYLRLKRCAAPDCGLWDRVDEPLTGDARMIKRSDGSYWHDRCVRRHRERGRRARKAEVEGRVPKVRPGRRVNNPYESTKKDAP